MIQWQQSSKPRARLKCEAKQRVGCRVLSQLFAGIARPMVTSATPRAFLGGLRVMAVDGTALDVPDSIAMPKSLVIPLLVTEPEQLFQKSTW